MSVVCWWYWEGGWWLVCEGNGWNVKQRGNKEEMWKHEEVNAGSSCADRLTYSAVLCLVYSEIDD